ncbi:MAG: WD40 repeat domain-containing serine/threonine protein kinase [Gemmataceae bacterium]
MSLSAAELAKILEEHRVLDAGHFDDLPVLAAEFPDGGAFAKHLVNLGWITAYQAECALTGHAPSLLFGDYRLLEPIGQGGMGQVFKAAHLRLGRVVALKMIRPASLRANQNAHELVRRFQREAQAVAQLLHPNIVILFDYNEIGGTHFIAMEYVDGVDLARMVQTQGPLPIPVATGLIMQAANGLQHAYEFGMVHRDIKPSNLLVTKPSMNTRGSRTARQSGANPRPSHDTPLPNTRLNPGGLLKILDMGLVRFNDKISEDEDLSALTMQGTVIGTPDFIAPEQARDATKVDIRADLYSLGCTFYYLLSGRAPFPNGTSVEKLFKHQNEQPMPIESIRPGMPKELVAIVQRLLAKRPEGRFQTPAELSDALGSITTAGTKTEPASAIAAAAMEFVQSERSQSQVAMPTQMFDADSLILPAKKLAVLQGHKGYVTALCFSNDGRLLASGGLDGTLRLWDVGMARPVERPLDQASGLGEVHHLRFSENSRTLYAGSTAMDGHNWRWDWISNNHTVRARFSADGYRTSCFAATPDGTHLAAGSASAVLIYDGAGSKKPTILKGHTGEVRCLAYGGNGKRLFSGGQDKTVRLWEPGRYFGALRATYQGHTDTVTSMALSPDGSIVASASLDGTVRIWDASGESTDVVAVLAGHSSGVRQVRFTSNGLLLSIGEGGQAYLWEVTEQTRIREWQFDKFMMHSLAVSPDCRYFATGVNDGQVAFYDLELLVGTEQPGVLEAVGAH